MAQAVIKTKDLKKQFENDEVITKVLHGIDLQINKGEFVAIMGPSGSGKSTLMHILGFLDHPTSGEFLFKGQDVSRLDDDQMALVRRDQIGFVFQSFNLLPRTTVMDNVMLPMMYMDMSHKERVEEAHRVVEAVGLGHRKNNYSNQLSGGEKQRVAIARALVNDPTVIFADEPTGNLDSKSGYQVMKLIQDLNLKQGHTVILVTHEKYTAEHAERIVRLRDGLVVDDAKVRNRQIAKNGIELKK